MSGKVTRDLPIINIKGLHARASAKFVDLVERHDAQAIVEKDGLSVSGDSIMGLLMLTAPRGSVIRVTTSGPDASQLADALEALVSDYFGEGM
ncbi:HPr family phosphocarrier protein [Paracoccus spongiarum]|uniref:HPr family phosphocarrier protein n=1 Tax=Paracoccus spongiarum TaxID=3064387 RepID=A0ABT9JAG7_9RHOB|nr:HPr family phosphocarrier protein [Paracoccus sp. 2205BS29-5]MDP5306794.1 HPr family phosphocarrier protein [Paracoccus sp. 2205BS29-5]